MTLKLRIVCVDDTIIFALPIIKIHTRKRKDNNK